MDRIATPGHTPCNAFSCRSAVTRSGADDFWVARKTCNPWLRAYCGQSPRTSRLDADAAVADSYQPNGGQSFPALNRMAGEDEDHGTDVHRPRTVGGSNRRGHAVVAGMRGVVHQYGPKSPHDGHLPQ